MIAAAVGLGIFAIPAMPAVAQMALGWLDRPSDEAAVPSYRDAIWHLSQVRFRLRATSALSDDQKQAIDILTLALVDGSDK